MKKIFFIFLCGLLPIFISAQSANQASGQTGIMPSDMSFIAPELGIANINGTPVDFKKKPYEGVRGTPFLFKDFRPGFVITKDTTNTRENLTYNYDGHANELHIRFVDGRELIPFSYQIEGFMIEDNNGRHMFKKMQIQGKGDARFYEVLYSSPQYEVFKWHVRQLVKANVIDRGIAETGKKYDEFVEAERFFVREKAAGQDFKLMKKLSKSEFQDALPDHKKQIEAAFKALNLNKRLSVEDVKRLLAYIDTPKQ